MECWYKIYWPEPRGELGWNKNVYTIYLTGIKIVCTCHITDYCKNEEEIKSE